jgi:hypothetical protein
VKRIPFLLVLRFRIRQRYFHIVVSVSRAQEQPVGACTAAGYFRKYGRKRGAGPWTLARDANAATTPAPPLCKRPDGRHSAPKRENMKA